VFSCTQNQWRMALQANNGALYNGVLYNGVLYNAPLFETWEARGGASDSRGRADGTAASSGRK